MRFLIRLSIFFVATLGWSVDIYAQNSSRINPQIKPPKAGDGVAQESSFNLMRLNLHRAFVSNYRVREIPAKQPVIATVQRQTRMARTNPNLGRPIVPWCGTMTPIGGRGDTGLRLYVKVGRIYVKNNKKAQQALYFAQLVPRYFLEAGLG